MKMLWKTFLRFPSLHQRWQFAAWLISFERCLWFCVSQWLDDTLKMDQDKVAQSSTKRKCHQQYLTSSQDEDCALHLKLEKALCLDPLSRIVVSCTFSSWWQKRRSRCGLNDSCASWLIVVAGKRQSTNGPRFHLPEQRPSLAFLMKVSAQAVQAVGDILRWTLANPGAIQCASNELPSLKWYCRQVFKQ